MLPLPATCCPCPPFWCTSPTVVSSSNPQTASQTCHLDSEYLLLADLFLPLLTGAGLTYLLFLQPGNEDLTDPPERITPTSSTSFSWSIWVAFIFLRKVSGENTLLPGVTLFLSEYPLCPVWQLFSTGTTCCHVDQKACPPPPAMLVSHPLYLFFFSFLITFRYSWPYFRHGATAPLSGSTSGCRACLYY